MTASLSDERAALIAEARRISGLCEGGGAADIISLLTRLAAALETAPKEND